MRAIQRFFHYVKCELYLPSTLGKKRKTLGEAGQRRSEAWRPDPGSLTGEHGCWLLKERPCCWN